MVIYLEVDIVLQKTLPCKVASLEEILKSMMMADVVATRMGAEVHLEAVVAVECKRTVGIVRVVCGRAESQGCVVRFKVEVTGAYSM